ncbi:T9SS type A sorting domain-containing protein [Ferruginibacter paludis]|uniref:T9SS type A sorting domain-containing protein n=1 Tax=Ferruginibacter paludis TaxID=1310417 RepID=UPI0025B58E00|nr:GEVED domain-containing protein [Ferruginibacter paludis]MDN3656679.1 T9SS type A sorting domain-containing protein [Ferruginibacter paludis]
MKKALLLTSLYVFTIFVHTKAQDTCPAITGLTVSDISSTSATFDWNARPVDAYNIEYRNTAATTWVWFGGGTAPHQDMSVFSPRITYEIRVRGSYYFGDCAPSAFVTFTTTGTPPSPAAYCAVKGTSNTYGWIKSVQLGTIKNVSENNKGYANFTSLSTNVDGNTPIPITVQAGASKTPKSQLWSIFVDVNNDGDFADAGETVAFFASVAGEAITKNIIIPATLAGKRRMRIKMRYVYDGNDAACGSFPYGEVEDYSINVTPSTATARTMVSAAAVVPAQRAAVSQFTMYPNPAKDLLTISYAAGEAGLIRITDISGRVLLEQAAINGNPRLNIAQLKKGMYFLTVQSKAGSKTRQFVKE